jgi:hypothetical protein
MACIRGDAGCRGSVSGIAGTFHVGAKLALAGGGCGTVDPDHRVVPPRPLQRDPVPYIYSQRSDHDRDDCFARGADSRNPATSRPGADIAAVGGVAVDHECPGVCAVVLEAGCGGSGAARNYAGEPGKFVFVSADVDAQGRGSVLVAQLRGLPVSCVQHEHGIFADGYGGAVAVGEGRDDAAINHFADDYCVDCGAGCECSLKSGIHLMQDCWEC